MANDGNEVRLAPGGTVYAGPVLTAAPTDATTVLNAAFLPLGYVADGGVTAQPKIATNDIMAWQSMLPVKTTLKSIGLTLKFNLLQVNGATTGLYFFGSSWTVSATPILTVSSNPTTDFRALVIEWLDDIGKAYRLYVPKGLVTDRDNLTIDRNSATAMGVTFEALDNNGTFMQMFTNNLNVNVNS